MSMVCVVVFAVIVFACIVRAMTGKRNTRFPKPWHGVFMIALGLVVGYMGAAGWLGGMKHREQDLDTIAFFVIGGLLVAVIGFVLLVWSAVRLRRGSCAESK